MISKLRVLHAAKGLVLPAIAVVFTACATKTTPEPPDLTPAGDGDIDLMLARFAKAVHVIADLNENGEATYQELLRVDADADDERFRGYDLDKSGGLSLQETTTAITNGEIATKLRSRFDPNHDGVIEAPEAEKFDKLIEATDGLRKFMEVERVFSQ
jgi:hypothetical protein